MQDYILERFINNYETIQVEIDTLWSKVILGSVDWRWFAHYITKARLYVHTITDTALPIKKNVPLPKINITHLSSKEVMAIHLPIPRLHLFEIDDQSWFIPPALALPPFQIRLTSKVGSQQTSAITFNPALLSSGPSTSPTSNHVRQQHWWRGNFKKSTATHWGIIRL